jgi:hypothetical protein
VPSAAKRENIGKLLVLYQTHWREDLTGLKGSNPYSHQLKSSATGNGVQRATLNTSNSHDAADKGNANPPFIWPSPETGRDEPLEGSLSGWRLLTGGTTTKETT